MQPGQNLYENICQIYSKSPFVLDNPFIMIQAWNKSVRNSVNLNMLFMKKKDFKKPSSTQIIMPCQWISSYYGYQKIKVFHCCKAFAEVKLQHSPIQLLVSQIFQLLDGKKVMIDTI